MEFFRRTNRAVAFVSSAAGLCRHLTACFHTGPTDRTTAQSLKMIIHVFSELEFHHVGMLTLPLKSCVWGVWSCCLPPLSVAELIRLLPQQLLLCPAPRIHFCANSMRLIKTVRSGVRVIVSEDAFPTELQRQFYCWVGKLRAIILTSIKHFLSSSSPGWSNISARTLSRKIKSEANTHRKWGSFLSSL